MLCYRTESKIQGSPDWLCICWYFSLHSDSAKLPADEAAKTQARLRLFSATEKGRWDANCKMIIGLPLVKHIILLSCIISYSYLALLLESIVWRLRQLTSRLDISVSSVRESCAVVCTADLESTRWAEVNWLPYHWEAIDYSASSYVVCWMTRFRHSIISQPSNNKAPFSLMWGGVTSEVWLRKAHSLCRS